MAVKQFGAAKSSYIVLGMPFYFLFAMSIYLILNGKGGNLWILCTVLAIIISSVFLWLKGFRITLSYTELTYRDGLYRTHKIRFEDIKSAKHAWVEFNRLNKDIKIPRFVIKSKHKGVKPISINTKPFVFEAVQALNELKT